MENSDDIWQWCGARKKPFTMSKIQSMADGYSSVPKVGSLTDGSSPNIIRKGNKCIDDSPLRRSSATFERNPLKSGAYGRDKCLPVKISIGEVGPFENGDSIKSPISVIRHHVSSPETSSDTKSSHPHGDSGRDGQFLPRFLGIADENSNQPSKSRVLRRDQKTACRRNSLFSDEGMRGSSGRYAACNGEPLVDASSSCSISKVIGEDMELQSRNLNGEMKDLSSNYFDWSCQPPATKKPKTIKSPFQIENENAKSEILFPRLLLLADVAFGFLQNDFSDNITRNKRIRKSIFIPTGVPFLQKRVVRKIKSDLIHHQPDAPQKLHDLQKNPSAANSKLL